MPPIRSNTNPTGLGTIDDYVERTSALISDFAGKTSAAKRVFNVIVRRTYNPLLGIRSNGFGRAASEKDPQGHLAGVVPRHAVTPALSRRNGHRIGFAKQCARGECATAPRRPRMTGRVRTHAGAAARRSNDYRPENGPRRLPSPICTGAGRRPSPTPSAAPDARASMPWTYERALVLGRL